MKPAAALRFRKYHQDLLGKSGQVIAATYVRVAAPAQAPFVPYSYVLVEIEGQKYELMGTGHDELQPGDAVVCVWRKLAQPDNKELIEYGIKVQKQKVAS
jgi:uncharacterized OB-fold protein